MRTIGLKETNLAACVDEAQDEKIVITQDGKPVALVLGVAGLDAEQLDFLTAERGQDEATILVEALRAGVEALYREALTEAYLLGRVPRETVLAELGQEELDSIECQRDVLRRDVEWAIKSA